MLVQLSVKNIYSYKEKQVFSLLPSSDVDGNTDRLNKTGFASIPDVLKVAGLFGANASGKSNLLKIFTSIRSLLISGAKNVEDEDGSSLFPMPFLLDRSTMESPSEFEVVFIKNGKRFRYGIEFDREKILTEWLYCAVKARETCYFERSGAEITINQRSFSEALPFIEMKNGSMQTKMTRKEVPYISVIAQFNGKISREVTSWFQDVKILSGVIDQGFRDYSIAKYKNDNEFKSWALNLLGSFQISDLKIIEEPMLDALNLRLKTKDEEINGIVQSIKTLSEKHKFTQSKLEIVKKQGELSVEFPLSFESVGTSKVIFLLGPLYDSIKNNRVLLIDELDTKLHTLLTMHVLSLFYKTSKNSSQIIFTAHDTNLLNENLLRRDQIWFADKDGSQSTIIYSLLEYREYYVRKHSSYSKDYLLGKYSAIPLFNSADEIKAYING